MEFCGYIGIVECIQIIWNNCPIAHQFEFMNTKYGSMATMGVQAWCDLNLYYCIIFEGRFVSHSDLTLTNFTSVHRYTNWTILFIYFSLPHPSALHFCGLYVLLKM